MVRGEKGAFWGLFWLNSHLRGLKGGFRAVLQFHRGGMERESKEKV